MDRDLSYLISKLRRVSAFINEEEMTWKEIVMLEAASKLEELVSAIEENCHCNCYDDYGECYPNYPCWFCKIVKDS